MLFFFRPFYSWGHNACQGLLLQLRANLSKLRHSSRLGKLNSLIVSVLLSANALGTDLRCIGESRYLYRTTDWVDKSYLVADPINADLAEEVCFAQSIVDCNDPSWELHGYRIFARTQAQGVVVVFPGNAASAKGIATRISGYSKAGFDVFVWDYRGHGESRGVPSLSASVSDARNLIRVLRAIPQYHDLPFAVHGISHGGIIAANAIKATLGSVHLVLDGVPATIPEYRLFFLFPMFVCPSEFDPIELLRGEEDQIASITVIAGSHDKLVHPRQTRPLFDIAFEDSQLSNTHRSLAHPFGKNDDTEERNKLYERIAKSIHGMSSEAQ